ncbi:MAG: hypothetical protein ACQEQS_02475 [Thermodesulfobacteriota bacterium]
MKQYVIDSLNIKDISSIKEVLINRFGTPFMDEIFSAELDQDVLNEEQKKHTECAPHYITLLLGETSLTAEILVRSPKTLRCSCMGYADDQQILWIINLVDDILVEANVGI